MTTAIDFTSIARAGRRAGKDPIPEEDLSPHLSYEGRDSYLGWVVAWKAGYRALTLAIRAIKAGEQVPGDVLPAECVLDRNSAKAFARAMLALRAAGKRDSWAKAKAAKAVREAAGA